MGSGAAVKLKNYTGVDTGWLRKMIAAVKPANVSKFDISFKNSQNGHRGRAYAHGCRYHGTWAPLVVVGLSKNNPKYPYTMATGNGYLDVEVYSEKEAALFVTAHELRHLWQAKVKSGWRVWGSRGQYSERDADAYGLRMLRSYRRGELGLDN